MKLQLTLSFDHVCAVDLMFCCVCMVKIKTDCGRRGLGRKSTSVASVDLLLTSLVLIPLTEHDE